MVYVALLRGINVGGNNKIDMKTLKKVFEEVGMNAVKTYINSGNVIFQVDHLSKIQISHILEDAIYAQFGLSIKVLIRSYEDIHHVIQVLPDSWTNDQQMRSDILFLWEDIDNDNIIGKLPIRAELDTVMYVSGAILWSIARKNVTRSGMSKLIGTKIYQQMTIRNVNTTRKIFELMQRVKS